MPLYPHPSVGHLPIYGGIQLVRGHLRSILIGKQCIPGSVYHHLALSTVDLRASNVAGSVSAQAGQSAQVQWTVQNGGTATTLASSWNDAVFLSTDSAYSPLTDVLVTTVPRSGTLSAGQSYSRNQTVTIPNGLSGSYHWIVRSGQRWSCDRC
ncbi:MAG: hypothetical protein IPP40_08775 [bacterium]|nr:hypothetical protein [bacterium]